jgi:pimeloyl-ACP methyl ester carboxylesterase
VSAGALIPKDDDLTDFDANGLTLPAGAREGFVENDGARIWYADYEGTGPAVVLLHGGLGNSGNMARQVPPLREAGYRAVAIDSRGHGRSSRDDKPLSYWLMAADVRAVMDHLGITRAAMVGWSDGADVGLVMAHDTPERVSGVLFFACNVDPSGTRPFEFSDTIGHCISRHKKDYAALSPTPERWEEFSAAVGAMQRTQPDYRAADLAEIRVPVLSLIGENDEFITPEHARYIAETIPGGEFVLLPGAGHFAPIQRPDVFNATMLDFLARVAPGR